MTVELDKWEGGVMCFTDSPNKNPRKIRMIDRGGETKRTLSCGLPTGGVGGSGDDPVDIVTPPIFRTHTGGAGGTDTIRKSGGSDTE